MLHGAEDSSALQAIAEQQIGFRRALIKVSKLLENTQSASDLRLLERLKGGYGKLTGPEVGRFQELIRQAEKTIR